MADFSKVYGPTDSVANTKTTVGTAAALRPEACLITEIIVGKGNVVNAKECAGFITIEAPGLEGPHHYAYGNGVGGATDSQNIAAEKIACSIPIGADQIVTVSVTDAEAAKDVTVSLGFNIGSGKNVYSYVLGGAGIDPAADTLLSGGLLDKFTGVTPKMGKSGRIREIRFAATGVTAAKAGTAKVEVLPPVIKGPWEYAVGNGPGGAATGGPSHADVIDTNIPVKSGESVVFNITAAEAMVSATLSFQLD